MCDVRFLWHPMNIFLGTNKQQPTRDCLRTQFSSFLSYFICWVELSGVEWSSPSRIECRQQPDKKLYVKCLKSRTIGCTRAEKAAQFGAANLLGSQAHAWAPCAMFRDLSSMLQVPSKRFTLQSGPPVCGRGVDCSLGRLPVKWPSCICADMVGVSHIC